MKIFKINNLKDFTQKLFITDVFDNFLLVEANFVTTHTTIIDGHKSEEYDGDEFVTWGKCKGQAFNAIKGKELPKNFKVVLKLSNENTGKTLHAMEASNADGAGFYLNIKYADGELNLTTGTSTTSFGLTKEISTSWDEFLEKFLLKKEISFE